MANRQFFAVALCMAAFVAACSTLVVTDSARAVYMARYDWISRRTPTTALWSHCTITREAHCERVRSAPGTYECSYQEWSSRGEWPLKRAVIRRDGEDWRWVEGDPPQCSIVVDE